MRHARLPQPPDNVGHIFVMHASSMQMLVAQHEGHGVWGMQSAPVFSVGLLDYYGSLGVNENAGQCQVTYRGTDVTLPELGRVVDIRGGIGTFQQFQILGGVKCSQAKCRTWSIMHVNRSRQAPEGCVSQ